MGSASSQTLPSTYRVPPCRAMGAQCRALRVTLRVGSFEDGITSLDHEATWLLGHTGQITFHELWDGEGDLYVEATLHLPCKHLEESDGQSRCRAHGFTRPRPRDPATPAGWQPVRGGTPRAKRDPRSTLPSPIAPGARNADGGRRGCKSLRHGPVPDRRQHDEGRLLPRPPDRDHVHAQAAHPRGSGAVAPVAVSLQDRSGGRSLDRSRDDLGVRIPGGRRRGLHPARPAPRRRTSSQAGPVQRVAAQEPGAPSRMRF